MIMDAWWLFPFLGVAPRPLLGTHGTLSSCHLANEEWGVQTNVYRVAPGARRLCRCSWDVQ